MIYSYIYTIVYLNYLYFVEAHFQKRTIQHTHNKWLVKLALKLKEDTVASPEFIFYVFVTDNYTVTYTT